MYFGSKAFFSSSFLHASSRKWWTPRSLLFWPLTHLWHSWQFLQVTHNSGISILEQRCGQGCLLTGRLWQRQTHTESGTWPHLSPLVWPAVTWIHIIWLLLTAISWQTSLISFTHHHIANNRFRGILTPIHPFEHDLQKKRVLNKNCCDIISTLFGKMAKLEKRQKMTRDILLPSTWCTYGSDTTCRGNKCSDPKVNNVQSKITVFNST